MAEKPEEKTKDAAPRGTMKQMNNLIRAIGGGYYNPLEATWHKWLKANRNKPGKVWMFIWIYEHTMAYDAARYTPQFATRSPFARNKKGQVLTLAHMAADRGTDIRNIRRDWDEGVEEGIWRHGDKEEGERAEGIYFRGKVAVTDEESAGDDAGKGVCTNPWEKLPLYAAKHLQTLPEPEQVKFWGRYNRYLEVRETVEADAILAARQVMNTHEDNLYSDFGATKNRQEHKNGAKSDEELKARVERLAKLQPVIEGFVQTLLEPVQSSESNSVQTDVQTFSDDATLLPQNPQKRQMRGLGATSEELVSRPRSSTPSHQGQKRHLDDVEIAEFALSEWVRSPKPMPLPHLSAETAGEICEKYVEAAQHFFFELPRIQEAFPNSDLANSGFDPSRKNDQILCARLIVITGAGAAIGRGTQFLIRVAGLFKGLDREAVAKLAPRSPGDPGGPKSFGLFLEWARDFARDNPLSEASYA